MPVVAVKDNQIILKRKLSTPRYLLRHVNPHDLADGQCYVNGRKNKELNRFFAKTAARSIIEHISEQNPHYGALLKFVYSKCNHGTTNIGRVFNLLRENYMGLESYYALDIYLDANYYGSARQIGDTFKKIPRALFPILSAISKIRPINASCINDLFNADEERTKVAVKLLTYIKDNINTFSNSSLKATLVSGCNNYFMLGGLIACIMEHNLDCVKAIEYANYVITYENAKDIYTTWRDYLRSHKQVQAKYSHKYTKYPKYLVSQHDIAANMVQVLKIDSVALPYFQELEDNEDKQFIMLCPLQSQELAKEGAELKHCVKTYIERVVERKTKVMFLRLKSAPEESHVTVEVYKNAIVQAEGNGRRKVTPIEYKYLVKYAQRKQLELRVHIK